MKILLNSLAALTIAGATLTIIFLFISPDDSFLWNAARLALSAFVIAIGLLTVLHIRRGLRGAGRDSVVFVGAMGLVALGAAGFVWTYHMAVVTGDGEGYATLITLLMGLQGFFTAWHLWVQARQHQGRSDPSSMA